MTMKKGMRDGVEVEVEVDDNGVPTDGLGFDEPETAIEDLRDDIDFEAEGAKRGYKNLLLETKKKGIKVKDQAAEIARLQKELEDAKKLSTPARREDATDQVEEEFKARMKAKGYDEEDIRLLSELAEYKAKKVTGAALSPYEEENSRAILNKTLSRLSSEGTKEDKLVISKIDPKEIEKVLLEKKIARQYWSSPDVIDSAIGTIVRRNPKILEKVEQEMEQPNDPGAGSGGAGAGAADMKEVQAYADKHGLSTKTKEDIASVRKQIKLAKENEELLLNSGQKK